MITLQTRVGELLERWPRAETVLLELSPVFAKLQNRMLRRTVARVATLEQAARVAGIAPQALLDFLNERLGTPPAVSAVEERSEPHRARPAWIEGLGDAPVVDADTLLETGEHPIGTVRRMLRENAGLRLDSSFFPAPLLEQLGEAGVLTHTEKRGECHTTWIAAPTKETTP